MAAPTRAQDFTLERLRGLLALDHPGVFWRHDVDYSLDAALEMAMLEAELGVQSTYYLRPDPRVYGVTPDGLVGVGKEIAGWGHELGVHVDLGLPRDATVTDEQMRTACREQAALLSHLRVYSRVSFHAPPHDVYWRDVPGFDHAMGPEWRGRYAADSRGHWTISPERLLLTLKRVQIGLHSEWYYMPEPERTALREREEVAP